MNSDFSDFDACRAYLAKLPPAISGAGGHPATFRAACECVRFGLGDGDAMTLLREWNRTHCQPAWTEKDLAHKLGDARRAAGGRVRSFRQPAQAVRVVWKIQRKTAVPVPVEAVEANPPTPEPILAEPIRASCASGLKPGREPDLDTAEVLPHFTAGGNLIVPFGSPGRFHFWTKRDAADGILALTEVRAFAEQAA